MRNARRRRLKAGAVVLDLHGTSRVEAQEQLERFINHHFFQGVTQLHVVTGLGKGVLRNLVRDSLSTSPLVAGYREHLGRFEVALEPNSSAGDVF
jgi:DNA-nicking Smr family endonuclease